MKKAILILGFAALAATGCVTYYKSSDVKDYFDSGVSMADKAVTDAEKDFAEKNGIIAGIRRNISDPSMPPYPQFDTVLAAMGDARDEIKLQAGLLKESRERAYGILEGKKIIESDQDDYKLMLEERDRYDDLFEDFKRKADRYERESGAYIDLARQYSVVSMKTADLEGKVQDYKSESDLRIAEARGELNRAEANLDAAVRADFDRGTVEEKRALLVRMGALLGKIEGKRDEVLALAERFRVEAGELDEFHVGPGMASHSLIASIREASADISSMANDMNDLAGKFNGN